MTTIPDGLPSLAKGSHAPNSGKACVMEYVSVITGNKWSDVPPCTTRAVAKAAQGVNDGLPDADRHLMVQFIDRLASAKGMNYELAMELWSRADDRAGFFPTSEDELADALYELGIMASRVYNTATNLYEIVPQKGVDFLEWVLTMHEKHVQHEVKPISPEALADAKRLIETRALITV